MSSIYWYFILFAATLSWFSKAEVLIVSTKSGLAFDVNEKNVVAVKPNNSESQKWTLESLQNGLFVIVNANNKLAMDVQKGCNSGQNIIVYKKHSKDNQQFKVNPDGTIETNCAQNLILQIKDGNVGIVPKAHSCSLDVHFKLVEVK